MAEPKKSNLPIILIAVAVVAILALFCVGVMAAIAIPSFVSYTKRAKTAEAETNLRAIYTAIAAYHEQETFGPPGAVAGRWPASIPPTPSTPPCDTKVLWPSDAPAGWREIGFEPAEPLYYQYELVSDPATQTATIRARGDLDCDGTQSLFELTLHATPSGIERAPGVFVENELE